MDPASEVPCALVADVLVRTGRALRHRPVLAVAGQTGTLRTRMTGTDATGRVQAKTGTLNEVNALAGFADTPTGNALTFVMVQNGLRASQISWVDRYAALLMSYAEAPALAVLGPKPLPS